MGINEREQLIASVGIPVTDIIEKLQNQIDELHEFLNVVKVAHTVGFKLQHRRLPEELRSIGDSPTELI